jgi:hypothetical protein
MRPQASHYMPAPYPAWVCADCGSRYGKRGATGGHATWHIDACGICGETKACTQPRDFGNLVLDWAQRAAVDLLQRQAQDLDMGYGNG